MPMSPLSKVCYRRATGRYMLTSRFTARDPKPTVGRFTDDRLRIRLRGSERLSDARKRCSRTCVHAETEVLSLQSIPPDRGPPSTVRVAFERAALKTVWFGEAKVECRILWLTRAAAYRPPPLPLLRRADPQTITARRPRP